MDDVNVASAVAEARASWATRIAESWRRTVLGIFETGRLIIEAKGALPHGEFRAMIEQDLPFKRSTAFRLMAIARDERLSNVAHVHHLPSSWGTLYELTKLDDERFEAKLRNGEIYADMSRKEVASENWLAARRRDEARVQALELAPGRCRTLVVDPPWDNDWNSPTGQCVGPGYAAMTQEQLLALPIGDRAEDEAHIYVWTTNHFMDCACELMKRWGFVHKSLLTWRKPGGQLGPYFRNTTEHVLFGVRGNLMTQWNRIATDFESQPGERLEHSEKPERFYEIVREASYPPYGEAFQRKARPDFVNLFRERQASTSPPASAADEGSMTEESRR